MNTEKGRSVKIVKEEDIPLIKPYEPANTNQRTEDDRLLFRPIILTSLGYEIPEHYPRLIFKNLTSS